MSPRHVAEVLPQSRPGRGSSSWMGMLLFLVIEATAYGAVITSYFYLQLGAERWPPDGIAPPDLLLPTIGTALLLVSTIPVRWAERGIAGGDARRLRIGLAIGLPLACAYPIASLADAASRSYSLSVNAYASIVWVASSYSLVHVVALLGLGAYALVHASLRRTTDGERHVVTSVVALYWYFAALSSIPIWATLYLAPRALGG